GSVSRVSLQDYTFVAIAVLVYRGIQATAFLLDITIVHMTRLVDLGNDPSTLTLLLDSSQVVEATLRDPCVGVVAALGYPGRVAPTPGLLDVCVLVVSGNGPEPLLRTALINGGVTCTGGLRDRGIGVVHVLLDNNCIVAVAVYGNCGRRTVVVILLDRGIVPRSGLRNGGRVCMGCPDAEHDSDSQSDCR